MAQLFLFALISGLAFYLFQFYQENEKLKRNLKRYESLSSQEDYQRSLAVDIALKQKEISEINERYIHIEQKYSEVSSYEELKETLETDISSMREELSDLSSKESQLSSYIQELENKLNELREEDYVQSFGFYQPKYDFISSGSYISQLKKVKTKQRKMVKENTAVLCDTSWTVQGSEKEGQKMVKNFQKLVLTIFNSECDSFISKLKYNSNVEMSEEKIKRVFNRLNKSAKVIHCEISNRYLDLKFQEMHLQYLVACEQQEEKERQQIIREEARERRKIEKYMKAAEEAEERENRFQQELEVALQEQNLSHGLEREKLERQIHDLRYKLERAKSDKDKANEQASLEKAGYIYVVSNIGSFGRDIYRICMTKKSGDPDEYVSAMAPSTPFPFDIHIRFVSENALETLAQLQQRFSNKRVNKARSERKGFFKVSLDEILNAVEEIKLETGHIKGVSLVSKAPPAYDYRRSQAMERKEEKDNESRAFGERNETA